MYSLSISIVMWVDCLKTDIDYNSARCQKWHDIADGRFRSTTRLILARYLTVYSTKLFTPVELYMLFRTRLVTAYSTNVN
jgi:hypothetical protein